MVRDALKDNWLPLTLLAIMAALSVYAWPRVPETLPVHWGLSGEPDRWAGRLQGLWLLPLITAGVFALLLAIPIFDPLARVNAAILRVARNAAVVVMAGPHAALVTGYLGASLDIPRVVSLAVGMLLLVVGNILPKARPNFWVGVRLPWLYRSDRAWNYAQRMSGWVMAITGAALLLAAILDQPPVLLAAIIGAMLLALVFLSVRSYLIWLGEASSQAQ